ncbi:hypothetical protein RHS01_02368 [Rhizoctonia solani]|uniref:Uncharacterized protein n=1 Tax=Rhizoctonia solani TaxID=456999 RepID=A0A8H7M7E6_9AGAM|nr:hypothetical protein RHS01_02368 [Rhizoctonia solani]
MFPPQYPSAPTGRALMLRPSKRRQKRRPEIERPQPHWFTFGSLRSFGKRLWNPPPPAKEERYTWLVKPRFTVQLEDVIADKHLSPLSRHDFEEYLRYFYEWVYRYRQIYNYWAESVLPTAGIDLPGSSKGAYRPRELWEHVDRVLLIPNLPPPYDEQEHTNKMPSFPNQPEPGIFDPILRHVRDALHTSFATFLRMAFCNAGLMHYVPGACGGFLTLAGGIVMWTKGMTSYQRGYVAGSLPLIWIGLWFMIVTLSGVSSLIYNFHRLVLEQTLHETYIGLEFSALSHSLCDRCDARQLYPWEIKRPLPPDVVRPPVYSLAPAPAPGPTDVESSSYSCHRRRSNGSSLLPTTSTAFSTSENTFGFHALLERRRGEGVLKMVGRPLCNNVLQVHQPATSPSSKGSSSELPQRRNAVVDLSMELMEMEERPDSPFSEENDFGIVVSDAFDDEEVPEVHHFSTALCLDVASTSGQDVAVPSIQLPEHAMQRRRTMPDVFACVNPSIRHENDGLTINLVTVETRRGSKSSEVEQGPELYYPWARTLYGPMTLVHSSLVRRAHWVTTWRTAAIATA